VCLHGFLDTWRTWELVLPALERAHDVLAPTLPGHAGGPPIEGDPHEAVLAGVERAMDQAGFETARSAAPYAPPLLSVARADGAPALIDAALRRGWPLDPERITCPVRIVWGIDDPQLPWPAAADGYRAALPQADWVELEDVGHAPQLEVPLEAAQLILGFTGA